MSNRLPILQNAALVAHKESAQHSKWAAQNALKAGEALAEAKGLCAHGQWAAWLAETGIPERTAQRYMKLHRAGCKSATVAEMGIARAERLASLGLKLWPQNGAGVEATGEDETGARFYAVVLPEGEGLVRYSAAYLFPTPDLDFMVAKRCGKPVALGVLHESDAEAFDRYVLRRMSAEETAAAQAELGVPHD
ncbi:DUF3102 domain-containing protein [Pararhodobacter sp. CCB-MM2]|uniref:DUF3102 domain-containing protein n=1 Tax=Pararhodobacter sp. CCB-MM2 TaxID=1786003 RepID=UPI000833F851|nr:DUF3102 domain-containing protein [Pararhodobacter sp. CCB-MM2]